MKIIRYLDGQDRTRYGFHRTNTSVEELEGDLFERLRPTGRLAAISKILAPIAPTAIIGIGLNYRRHAIESKMQAPDFPVVFAKGLNTVLEPHGCIQIPVHLPSAEVDYECELAVVIGKRCKNVSRTDALGYVLGYTCANDVSARDWQIRKGGGQWCRGKFFDTFCPLGPCLVTPDEIGNPNALAISTRLNGEKVQDWNTNDMIFDVPAIIEFLSGSTTLLPGTVILTGTPHGVGMAATPPRWLRPGDQIEIAIEKIGNLVNTAVLERVPLPAGG